MSVVSDDGGVSDGGPAVDDGAFTDSYVVCYGCVFFDGSVLVEEDDAVSAGVGRAREFRSQVLKRSL